MLRVVVRPGQTLWSIAEKADPSATLGEHALKGTIKDGKLAFEFSAEAGGQSFTMNYSGKVVDTDNLSGSIQVMGNEFGTFAAAPSFHTDY